MQRTLTSTLVFIAATSGFGCSSESPSAGATSGSTSGGTPSDAPTYHRDVAPILQRSCMGCHSAGNIGPFEMATYEAAKPYASLMAQETEHRTMPPWGAQTTDECQPRFPWADDEQLTDDESLETVTIETEQQMDGEQGDARGVTVKAHGPPAGESRKIGIHA